jgi:hypothetical protein
MMPQEHRAQVDALDAALRVADFDVFPESKRGHLPSIQHPAPACARSRKRR